MILVCNRFIISRNFLFHLFAFLDLSAIEGKVFYGFNICNVRGCDSFPISSDLFFRF